MQKKDEMEQQIANKSIKVTWIVTVISLLIVGYSDLWVDSTLFDGTGGYRIIGILSVVLYLFLERFYFSRVTDKSSFIKFIGLVALFTFIMILGSMLLVW